MNNLEIYNKVRVVPKEAQRAIGGGKLKGKTDINPMWRIKTLTEQFGPCGIGWKYNIKRKWLEQGACGEIAAFVDIELFYIQDGLWSDAVEGTGGSMLVSKEKGELVTNDECYKMALTDAISVACKALGFGADIYWEGDRTKYDIHTKEEYLCVECGTPFKDVDLGDGKIVTAKSQFLNAKEVRGGAYCKACHDKRKAEADGRTES